MNDNTEPRKGMPSPRLAESEFKRRFLAQFQDPVFDSLAGELQRIAAAAWDGYSNTTRARFLLINCSSRNEHTCPGEMSKSFRLTYRRHLKGRLFAVVVHGDTEGAEGVRRSITDWLASMELCAAAGLDR